MNSLKSSDKPKQQPLNLITNTERRSKRGNRPILSWSCGRNWHSAVWQRIPTRHRCCLSARPKELPVLFTLWPSMRPV